MADRPFGEVGEGLSFVLCKKKNEGHRTSPTPFFIDIE